MRQNVALCGYELNVTQIKSVFHGGRKNCGKKEKMLITSTLSFSNTVFKRYFAHGNQKSSLCGKGQGLTER